MGRATTLAVRSIKPNRDHGPCPAPPAPHVKRLLVRQRGEHLTELLASCRPPLQLAPATTRHDEALSWLEDYAAARVGVEGVICKSLTDPYIGGRRSWRTYRTRDTLELLVGAVTGTIDRPERLVLAYLDDGEYVVAGGTIALTRCDRTPLG